MRHARDPMLEGRAAIELFEAAEHFHEHFLSQVRRIIAARAMPLRDARDERMQPRDKPFGGVGATGARAFQQGRPVRWAGNLARTRPVWFKVVQGF